MEVQCDHANTPGKDISKSFQKLFTEDGLTNLIR